jgi:hypothetical protein
VTVALSDVAARLGYPGTVSDVRITRTGPSGRALEVVLDGSAGPKPVTGLAFDAALGLRSTLFGLRVEAGVAPPPPPPAEDAVIQAPPEEAAAVAAVEVPGATQSATPKAVPTHRGQPRDAGPPEEAVIFASWAVLAAVGAAGLLLSGSMPRRRPSPSAPPSEGGSP